MLQAIRCLAWTERVSPGQLRGFLASIPLPSVRLSDIKNEQLPNLTGTALRTGLLSVLRQQAIHDSAVNQTVELRRLVQQIARLTSDLLSYEGRRYKLVVDIDLARTSGRDNYEVVEHRDAERVLGAIAVDTGSQTDLASLLARARSSLSPDWRPPLKPDGLVLLRRMIAVLAPTSSPEPAMTPSQIRKLLDEKKEEIIDWTLWIELDPDDPKAQDDTVILLDAGYEEVERVQLSGCAKSGSGVLVIFKQVDKHSRYTLIRDYGPDEGGGQDTLFIDRSPAELEEECKKSS